MLSVERMCFFIILLYYSMLMTSRCEASFVEMADSEGAKSKDSQINIPDELRECYANNNMHNFRLPMNLRVLVDIIRKAEMQSYTTMDIRTMSSSLMHRFKFDGIKYYKDVKEGNGVLPFGRSGKQSVKYKLIKKMVPGKPEIFPFDALTPLERCTLHQAISNTIMRDSTRDTNSLCEEIGQKLTNSTISPDLWNCPREYGVILTPYGTIAPGSIIGAIAASLQHQDVNLSQILDVIERPNNVTDDSVDYTDQIDFIMPKEEMIRDRSMSYFSSLKSNITLDNVWLATIAGNLAEVIAYQIPVSKVELGNDGYWKNMRSSVYYLKNGNGHFDATRAEIIGDIDGFIIASHVQNWVNDFNSLRLSQILDMYYTDEGITLSNENVKVCNRKDAFSQVAPNTLLYEQIFGASYVLASRTYIVFTVSLEMHERMVNNTFAAFTNYVYNHLLKESLCQSKKLYPQVEVFIAFDGAWTKEYTMDFIATLINDLDVSMYGSKMGILHGTSGEWLLNVTNSPSFIYYAVSNFTTISWPNNLDLIAILSTVLDYLNETLETNWQQHEIGSLGRAVVILAPSIRLSETEQQMILKLIREIKRLHPNLNFLYYTSEYNSYIFQPFILSEHDRLIISPSIDAIAQFLYTVPRILRPVLKLTKSSQFRDKTEGYISPSKSTTYVLNPRHVIDMKTTITVSNFGYGTIEICTWNQSKIQDPHEVMMCQSINQHVDINLIDDFKCTSIDCPYLFIRIQNAISFRKCAEIECESPNQVRYIIWMQNSENSASKKTLMNILVIFYIYLQLIVFNM